MKQSYTQMERRKNRDITPIYGKEMKRVSRQNNFKSERAMETMNDVVRKTKFLDQVVLKQEKLNNNQARYHSNLKPVQLNSGVATDEGSTNSVK